jgi:hypothetical protein
MDVEILREIVAHGRREGFVKVPSEAGTCRSTWHGETADLGGVAPGVEDRWNVEKNGSFQAV